MYWSPLDVSGSASYVQGGDAISPQSFGFNSYIWQLTGGVSQSGNYRAEPRALNSGFTQWQLVWFVVCDRASGGSGSQSLRVRR